MIQKSFYTLIDLNMKPSELRVKLHNEGKVILRAIHKKDNWYIHHFNGKGWVKHFFDPYKTRAKAEIHIAVLCKTVSKVFVDDNTID